MPDALREDQKQNKKLCILLSVPVKSKVGYPSGSLHIYTQTNLEIYKYDMRLTLPLTAQSEYVRKLNGLDCLLYKQINETVFFLRVFITEWEHLISIGFLNLDIRAFTYTM